MTNTMPMLADEKCREQFEDWFADHSGQTIEWVKSQRSTETHYKIGPEIQRFWMAWQASRQALEIALPVLEQQEKEVSWGAPKSVGQLISQLQTFEPETEITALQRIENYLDGKQIRQVPLSISWERMEGPWLAPFKGDGRKVIAFWAKPDPREDSERGELITSTTPQIDNDGWIDWDGVGGYPTMAKALVEVKHKAGHLSKGFADQYYWSHPGLTLDIVAYRVIENDGREG